MFSISIPDDEWNPVEMQTMFDKNMLTIFQVTIVLYFIQIRFLTEVLAAMLAAIFTQFKGICLIYSRHFIIA